MKIRRILAGVPRSFRNRVRWLPAILCLCLFLVQIGCGIPAARRALPGPALPQVYFLNNGASRGSHGEKFDYYQAPATEPNGDGAVARPPTYTEITANPEKAPQSAPQQLQLVSLIQPATESEVPKPNNSTPNEIESAEAFQSPVENSNAPAAAGSTQFAMPQTLLEASTSGDPMAADQVAIGGSSPPAAGDFFQDPYLLELIELAMVGNQELRILSEEINIARNEVYARSGEYRPFVTAGAGAGLEKSSRFSRDGAVEDQLEGAPGEAFPEPLPEFLVATNVSWELDIWRKLRNAQCAAAMRYLGTRDGRNYIVTRLVAEVADSYYELLALDNRLLTLQKTIEIQEQSLQAAESMKAAGRGTELAVQRFQGEVRKNQSRLLIIQQEIVEAENRVNFLVGRYPQPVERSSVNYVDLHLNTLAAGIPADLLLNRADIREAERNVSAAGLDLRVARARFYPSLGLRAGVGLNAFNTRYLLTTPESLIYNVALDLVGPLINKRAIQADYCSANAAQLQAVYDYQQTVLTAHIEVVNFLTKVENYRESIEFKKRQLEALEASVAAADQLFQNARAEYIEVLLAQREMMEARMDLIETKQQQLMAIVDAYQALGGGIVSTIGP